MTEIIERTFGPQPATHAIIWLHGLGATADDFVPVIPYLGLQESLSIRFIFPQAPSRPITINQGYVMPGWYDIKGTNIQDKEDLPGITDSKAILDNLIEEQISKGVTSENIILAGFSQGGAVAYYTGIRSKHKLAGILALSTYLPFTVQAEQEHSSVNTNINILAMHGTLDPIVPISAGKTSVAVLKRLGYSIDWREYVMEHSVIPEQLGDIGAWINNLFS